MFDSHVDVWFDFMSKLSVKNSLLAAICVNLQILSVTYLSTHSVVDARKQSKIATGMALRPPFGSRLPKFPNFLDSGKKSYFPGFFRRQPRLSLRSRRSGFQKYNTRSNIADNFYWRAASF